MALARFHALNVDSSEDSEGDEENPAITREALEEKAAAQYRDILVLQRNKKWKEAETEFKSLLESDVLNRVTGTVNYVSGRIQPSLVHLKYCLLVNLGHVLIETGQIKEALDSYLQAIELDDRDLNLWYRIGQTAIKIPNLNLAAYALQEALQCNEKHWPSLDTLITVLYASGNYMSCLYHISEGLKLDPDFFKGIAFCQKIFKEHPYYERDFPLYYPECKLDESILSRDIRAEVDESALDRILADAERLRSEHLAATTHAPCDQDGGPGKKAAESVRPDTPLPKRCWVAVGRALLQVYARLKEEYPKQSFLRIVDLAQEEKEKDEGEKEEDKEEKKTEYDWYDADDDDNSDDETTKVAEGVTAADQAGEAAGDEGVNGSAAVRSSKRRRCSSPTLLDQWMSSSKRRSARVRSTACGRRADEPTLARALRRLLPDYLWPPRREAAQWAALAGGGDESVDTMDLYRLFENKDSGCQESAAATNVLSYNERTKLIKEENYFNTDKEVEEVDRFIKENNLVNILSLITSYVKVVAQKWNLYWSPALIAIYIKVYKLVRHHYPEACEWQPLDMASAQAVLLYGELLLDRWLANGKQRSAPSPLAGSLFGGDFSSLTFGNLAVLCGELGDEDAEFVVRCYWLEAIMYLHVKSRDAVMIALERYLADGRCCGVHLKLKNVANNFSIDEDNVMRLYNTLKRNEELDKVV